VSTTLLLFQKMERYIVGVVDSLDAWVTIQSKVFTSQKKIDFFSDRGIKLVSIRGGSFHVGAIDDKGALYMWGKNDFGQLGLGDFLNRKLPVLIEKFKDSKVTKISCGGDHSLCVLESGEVFVFGSNEHKQLGLLNGKKINEPQNLTKLIKEDTKFIDAKAGRLHSNILDDQGRVYSMGMQNKVDVLIEEVEFQKKSASKIVEICSCDSHSVAVSDEGKLFTWGQDNYGKLGRFGVDKLVKPTTYDNKKIIGIGGGSNHTFILTET